MTNIRQASITDEIGIVCLELDGARSEVAAAIKMAGETGGERGASGRSA
ncbi:MAG: hypothetical protein WDN00_13815 [Limisphaerales bacterium]